MSPWWLRPPADSAEGTEPNPPDAQPSRWAESTNEPSRRSQPGSTASVFDLLAPPSREEVAAALAPEPFTVALGAAESAADPDREPVPPFRTESLDPDSLAAAENEDGFDDEEAGEEAESTNGDEPIEGESAEVTATRKRRRRRRRRGGAEPAIAPVAAAVANPTTAVSAPTPVASQRRQPAAANQAPAVHHNAHPTQHDDEEDEWFEAPPALGSSYYLPIAARPHLEVGERKIALFCDFENIALGVRDSEIKKFDINLVLARLLEKGKIIVKRAYADWERYSEHKRALHEAAIELIDIPQKSYSGKNSADIKMVVDAMDLCYAKEHLDTFVLMSGDSDFSPLVSKLKENNKTVIGVGVKNSSSALLVDNCDEFLYYEDVWRERSGTTPQVQGLSKKQTEVFSVLVDAIQALKRENKDVLWGSMIKQTMQRKKPSFNEGYYGYSTFSELLQDAERNQIVNLKRDQRAGTYIVTGFPKRKSA